MYYFILNPILSIKTLMYFRLFKPYRDSIIAFIIQNCLYCICDEKARYKSLPKRLSILSKQNMKCDLTFLLIYEYFKQWVFILIA